MWEGFYPGMIRGLKREGRRCAGLRWFSLSKKEIYGAASSLQVVTARRAGGPAWAGLPGRFLSLR
jgi:hypothetical protein